jgi:VanZ family protein
MTPTAVSHLRLRQAGGLLLIAVIVYESLTSNPIEVPAEHGDKYGHIVAYSILMMWWALIYRPRRQRIGLAIAFVLLGVALEFLQLLTDHRTFEVADMVADACGVLVGWLVVYATRLPWLAAYDTLATRRERRRPPG